MCERENVAVLKAISSQCSQSCRKSSPTGFVVLSVMIALGTFHAINGIRLMFQQGGLGIGTPTRPDYPYQIQSMGKKNRLCIYVTMGVSALALYYALDVFF